VCLSFYFVFFNFLFFEAAIYANKDVYIASMMSCVEGATVATTSYCESSSRPTAMLPIQVGYTGAVSSGLKAIKRASAASGEVPACGHAGGRTDCRTFAPGDTCPHPGNSHCGYGPLSLT